MAMRVTRWLAAAMLALAVGACDFGLEASTVALAKIDVKLKLGGGTGASFSDVRFRYLNERASETMVCGFVTPSLPPRTPRQFVFLSDRSGDRLAMSGQSDSIDRHIAEVCGR